MINLGTGEKRIIHLVYDKIAKTESDVIYFLLTREAERGMPSVELSSLEKFNYRNFAMILSPIMVVRDITNLVGDVRGYWRVSPQTVLDTLVKENDCGVFFREDSEMYFERRN